MESLKFLIEFVLVFYILPLSLCVLYVHLLVMFPLQGFTGTAKLELGSE